MEPLEATAGSLTELLLPIMRYRMKKFGVDASGAYNFYRSRLDTNCVFAGYEIQLAKQILARFAHVDEVHEIGCGWGQLVFLLAWSGYAATGFEVDSCRFRGAEYLHKVLGEIDGSRVASAKLRNEFFPPLDRPAGNHSMVISTNIVVSDPDLVEEQVVWALRRYRYAIVDVDRFCRLRAPDGRQGLIAAVELAGLKSAGLFCDAGPDGQYYLFERNPIENDRAQGRPE
jgi:hypothetical protein